MAYRLDPRVQEVVPRGRGPLLERLAGPLGVVLLVWVAFILQPLGGRELLLNFGVPAHDFTRPWTYFTSIFLHGSVAHVSGNTTFLALLGVLIGLEGRRRWLAVFVGSAIGAGLFISAFTPVGLTIGASGIVFGYFGYILAAALVERTPWVKLVRIVVAIVLLSAYSATILVGFLPSGGVSWQAHVGGFVGGIVVAVIAEKVVEPRSENAERRPPNPY